MDKTQVLSLASFNYGEVVRIRYKNAFYKTVMQLNFCNDFFLDFVAWDAKLHVIIQLFIPYILSIRLKLGKKQLKIRVENHDESFYIINESLPKLESLMNRLIRLKEHIQSFKYARYSWSNLQFNFLYEFKINDFREKFFSELEVSKIISKMKLSMQRASIDSQQKSDFQEELEERGIVENIDQSKTEEDIAEVISEIYRTIRSPSASVDMDLISKAFEVLACKNELANIFKHYKRAAIDNDSETSDQLDEISGEQKVSDTGEALSNDYSELQETKHNLLNSKQEKISDTIKSRQPSEGLIDRMQEPDYFVYPSSPNRSMIESIHNSKRKRNRSLSMARGPRTIVEKESHNHPDLKFTNLLLTQHSAFDLEQNMSFQNFLNFLDDFQQQKITVNFENNLQLFFNHVRMLSIFGFEEKYIQTISFKEFCMFIFSKLNSIVDCDLEYNSIDLTRPLSEYFVNSSHNTYLIGHQLYGKSGIEGYERALEKGVRCIEIDCWDKDEDPIVTHGHTLIKCVLFSEVIFAIAKMAFVKSNFPLIISLEMHCNYKNRCKIASMIKNAFGNRLFVITEQNKQELPILSDLMGKVLIKCAENTGSGIESSLLNPNRINPPEPLLAITSLFGSKKKDLSNYNPYMMLSSDEEVIKAISSKKRSVADFARNRLVRIYPSAIRIASSNFNPIGFWSQGCQMVALNLQTRDEWTLINKTMFFGPGNRKDGFLPKPVWLETKEIPQIQKFKIEVLSAQILSQDLVDENDYLEISFQGHPFDEAQNPTTHRLNIIQNFLHPTFVQPSKKTFFEIRFKDLAFFCFNIRNAETIKSRGVVKASCMREGLRVLHLYDSRMFHNYYSYLLLRIREKEN